MVTVVTKKGCHRPWKDGRQNYQVGIGNPRINSQTIKVGNGNRLINFERKKSVGNHFETNGKLRQKLLFSGHFGHFSVFVSSLRCSTWDVDFAMFHISFGFLSLKGFCTLYRSPEMTNLDSFLGDRLAHPWDKR